MKVLIFIALLALVHCSDTASSSNILIGTWTVTSSKVEYFSQCCMPIGTMTIVDNDNDSITMTTTSWGGDKCNGISSSFELTFTDVDGSDSWNELAPTGTLYLQNSIFQGAYEISLTFSSGQDVLSLYADIYGDQSCYGVWTKSSSSQPASGKLLGLASATLIAALIALFM
jgi:hypothetical protein